MAAAAPRTPVPLFTKTLLASLLLHLSGITLFSIVLYFPKQQTHYYHLALVREPDTQVLADDQSPGRTRIAARMSQPKRDTLPESFSLPEITDPSLDVDALHVGGHSFFEETPERAPDSWARFGQGIQQVRSSLLGLAGVPPLRLGGAESATNEATLDFGAGLRAVLEWGGNAPREVLFTPAALFSGAPADSGVEFFVTVDASGAVSNAVSMSATPTPFDAEAVAFLRGCRFTASTRGQASNVTVRVSAVGERAAP